MNKKSLLTNQHKKNMKKSDQPKAVSSLYEGKAAFRRGAASIACARTVAQFLITTCLANFRNSGSFVLLFDWILLRRIDSTLFANMSIAKQQLAHPNRRTRNVQSPCVTKAESAAKCSSFWYSLLTCWKLSMFTWRARCEEADKIRPGSSSSSVDK